MMLQYADIDQSNWARTCGECDGRLNWVFHRVHEFDDGKLRKAEFRSVCVAECPGYRETKGTGLGSEYVDVSESWEPTCTRWW
ncbi:MAG: hypothetical protein QOK45_1337 [Mycobacterium sp.]|jgi:hypothetical protein|nr:hypothetical protein [Mycobacterium sp.]MDT7731084.1 hypothetical protein [Mycobacterium sp.]MDT7792365.1 hypothetical protein [Mycobacterium sp.]